MNVSDQVVTDQYALYCGDSAEVLPAIPDKSIGLSVYSPPVPEPLHLFAIRARPG